MSGSPGRGRTLSPLNLAVFSNEANNLDKVRRKAPDSVQVEDIYRCLAQEIIPEQTIDLCTLHADILNPIQRECMFRMPGRAKREPISHFDKFRMQSQCLCRKYGYKRVRDALFK